MALSIITGEYKVNRTDNGWLCDPRGLECDFTKNLARQGQRPPVDDSLIQLANSLLPKDPNHPERRGQQQPIKCRLLGNRHVEVYEGYRRMAAALWLVEQGHAFNILFTVTKNVSDEDAAIDNVVENLHRLQPEPIQLAYAIKRLEEGFGWSVKDIAAKLGITESWIKSLGSVTALPEKIQDAVKDKKMSVQAAIELAKVPDRPTQVALFDAVATAGGKTVTAKEVKEAKRATADAAAAAGQTTTVVPPQRNTKHVKAFLEGVTGRAESKEGRALANAFLKFIAGTLPEEKLTKEWYKVFPAPAE